MKDLYHGTTYDINEIDVTMGKGYKDFGNGFYATSVKSHAESIVRRNKRILEAREAKIRQRNPKYKLKTFQAYRYNFEFDDSCIDNLENLPKQYFFGTSAAIQKLRFKKIRRESLG